MSVRAWRTVGVLGTLVVLVAAFWIPLRRAMPRLHAGEALEPAAHVYDPGDALACAVGSRPGPPGRSPDERTADGVRFLVEAPINYDATRAHPLIVVYAPHGVNRSFSERYVGLTHEATKDGFVVAYADSRVLDRRSIAALGKVGAAVASRWCIDAGRVFFTGHSDGGTVATALAVLGGADPAPAAIAPSAAGFRGEELASYPCSAPLPVLVLHSRNDELFPAWGRATAAWWSRCNGCSGVAEDRADGCRIFGGCRADGRTMYCEGAARHVDWPERNRTILDFFRAAPPRR
jgi:polyhydroxybutyrate depolymerase